MAGDGVGRKAEDIGGQELSYAEVKAIASGNPAVLTLAEADAELQRLNLLRRGHSDEQYLARRRLRELPDAIESQKKRLANLEADEQTVADHAEDRIVIGKQAYSRRRRPGRAGRTAGRGAVGAGRDAAGAAGRL